VTLLKLKEAEKVKAQKLILEKSRIRERWFSGQKIKNLPWFK
jgi:hypothetical protein